MLRELTVDELAFVSGGESEAGGDISYGGNTSGTISDGDGGYGYDISARAARQQCDECGAYHGGSTGNGLCPDCDQKSLDPINDIKPQPVRDN